jgi:hypothetical protein
MRCLAVVVGREKPFRPVRRSAGIKPDCSVGRQYSREMDVTKRDGK